jgi:hypothetical protein
MTLSIIKKRVPQPPPARVLSASPIERGFLFSTQRLLLEGHRWCQSEPISPLVLAGQMMCVA